MAEKSLRQAFVGAGANLGDREATLAAALGKLRSTPGIAAVESSPIYETAPVGKTDQPVFLNLAAGIETTLTPEELLEALLGIERQFGRIRTERWGPRTLDLDLLLFEGETRATTTLTLPHPRMFERTFVTVPLRELLETGRFQRDCWTDLRDRLAPIKSGGEIAVFRGRSL
ncbi:MAG TPA: 2-amino-4-hydroxy-6-hydroxymethyldihydropteridine diphosphokinase [Opitutaceae bacterium]|nr:2-amino-4-hydroxy-6-hydroxymethyldihydropteridine diphosphokinase [Opitutaceae bacterium]